MRRSPLDALTDLGRGFLETLPDPRDPRLIDAAWLLPLGFAGKRGSRGARFRDRGASLSDDIHAGPIPTSKPPGKPAPVPVRVTRPLAAKVAGPLGTGAAAGVAAAATTGGWGTSTISQELEGLLNQGTSVKEADLEQSLQEQLQSVGGGRRVDYVPTGDEVPPGGGGESEDGPEDIPDTGPTRGPASGTTSQTSPTSRNLRPIGFGGGSSRKGMRECSQVIEALRSQLGRQPLPGEVPEGCRKYLQAGGT